MEQKNGKLFLIKGNDQKDYELRIILKKDSLEFFVQEYEKFSEIIYKIEYSHDKLSKLNNIFKMYNNIIDDFDKFFNKCEKDKISIIFENDSIISVIFKYQIFNEEEKIKFDLQGQKLDSKDFINIISQKKKENEEMKNKIILLEKENENLRKENETLKSFKFYNDINLKQKDLINIINIKKENELLNKKLEILFGDISFDFEIDEFKKLYSEFKKYSRIIENGKDLELILRGIKKTVNKIINEIKLLMYAINSDASFSFHSY